MTDLPDSTAAVQAFLEAHFYDGGLRTVPLGLGGARPDWAPDAERVGFRDEFVLGDTDQIVEFYRMLHHGRRLTWLAVYRRSIDRSYGDRRNHAGIGVWLIDQMIVDPHKLLKALGVMADAVGASGPASLEGDAANFLSTFLPKHLLDTHAVPASLHGWNHSSPEEAQTQAYVARADVPDQPFEQAASQIAALSWLPGPDPRTSRAVILIQAVPGDTQPGGRYTPEPIERDPLPAILRQIPIALAEMTGEGAQLQERLRLAVANHEDLSRRLDAGQTAHAALTAQAAQLQAERDELHRQIDTSDPLKMLNRICTDLDVVRRQTASLDQQLPVIERLLRHRGPEGPSRSGSGGSGEGRRSRAPSEASEGGWPGAVLAGIAVFVIAAIGIVVYVLMMRRF